MKLESYQELRTWQLGMEIAEDCYRLTKRFPREELFGLTSQIRRCSSRIPATIAEGYGRGSKAEYVHFLRIARGSLKELETHLMLSVRIEIADGNDVNIILAKCDEEGKMLGAQIRSLEV